MKWLQEEVGDLKNIGWIALGFVLVVILMVMKSCMELIWT